MRVQAPTKSKSFDGEKLTYAVIYNQCSGNLLEIKSCTRRNEFGGEGEKTWWWVRLSGRVGA